MLDLVVTMRPVKDTVNIIGAASGAVIHRLTVHVLVVRSLLNKAREAASLRRQRAYRTRSSLATVLVSFAWYYDAGERF